MWLPLAELSALIVDMPLLGDTLAPVPVRGVDVPYVMCNSTGTGDRPGLETFTSQQQERRIDMTSVIGTTDVPADSKPDKQPALAKNEVGLGGSVVFALAGAAPGQTVSIVLASLVATAAYGTILPLVITTLGLLCIAVAFQRLNMWRQNAGATYEWVCRAVSSYAGNLVGWLMLIAFGGFVLIDVITIGPSVLALLGISPNNQWAGAAAIVIIGSLLIATAVVGLRPSARLQITVALIEYSILAVFIVWAFIEVYLVHKTGTVRPTTKWLSFSGTGAGLFSAAMVIAVASIAGWDAGIYVNEETSRPEKNPGLGAVIAVAILGVIFVLMFATFQGIAPLSALNAHSSNAAAFVGHRLGGTAGDRVISLAVVLSVLATTQVAIIGTARLIYSMSRDRVLPVRSDRSVSGSAPRRSAPSRWAD